MPPEVQRVMESLSSQRSLARTVEEIKDRRAVRPVLAYMEKLGPEMVDAILHSRDNHMHEVLQSPGWSGRWLGVLDDLPAPAELEEARLGWMAGDFPGSTGGLSSRREQGSGCRTRTGGR